jgi:hypothetical protein
LDVDQILVRRNTLEKQLFLLLRAFEEETSLSVGSVELMTALVGGRHGNYTRVQGTIVEVALPKKLTEEPS